MALVSFISIVTYIIYGGMNHHTAKYGMSVIYISTIFVVLRTQLYGFYDVLLQLNNCTKVTAVWGIPEFSTVFHARITILDFRKRAAHPNYHAVQYVNTH